MMAAKGSRAPRATFSFILPTCNSAATICQTLQSIFQQVSGPLPFEVIVADDRSHDATLELIRENFPAVQILESTNSRRLGPGGTRNRGAQAASGVILCFIDSDVLLQPGWLKTVAKFMARYQVDALNTQLIPIGQDSRSAVDQFRHEYKSWRTGGTFLDMMLFEQPIPCLTAAVLVIRRSVFSEIGGFSEGLKRNEDDDLSMRLTAAGGVLAGISSATAHDEYERERSELSRLARFYRRSFVSRYFHARPTLKLVMKNFEYFHFLERQSDASIARRTFAFTEGLASALGSCCNPINSVYLDKPSAAVTAAPALSLRIEFLVGRVPFSLAPHLRLLMVDKTVHVYDRGRTWRPKGLAQSALLKALQRHPADSIAGSDGGALTAAELKALLHHDLIEPCPARKSNQDSEYPHETPCRIMS